MNNHGVFVSNLYKQIRNKQIESFMLRQVQPYYTRYKYGKKTYIMTFEYNLYEVLI